MQIGVDFGTTNSTAAVYDGEQLHTLIVDTANEEPRIMPSLIYIDQEANQTVGASAAQLYLEAETGRPVQWQKRDVGEFEITIASFEYDPISYLQSFNILVDTAANGRLLQSIKRGLFNDRYEGTHIFGRYYRVDQLIAIILKRLRTSAEQQLGKPCSRIVLGRPVQFSTNPAADYRAESILLKAAHLAGFTEVELELEPVGIAHLIHQQNRERQTVLVFDFGGGTLDLTVANVGGSNPPQILATQGVLVGGDDLDRRIMELLLPYFGGGDDGRLPLPLQDKLLAWQTMPELSQPMYIEQIRDLQRSEPDPMPYQALEKLVSNNLGFKLFKEIERVKRILSTEQAAVLDFNHENIHIKRTITRRRFESLISSEVSEVTDGIRQVLHKAMVSEAEIDLVLRTGGTSLVPAFYELLISFFGEEKQYSIDPLVSVVGGFAVKAYHQPLRQTYAPQQVIRSVDNTSPHQYDVYQTGIGASCYTDRDFVISRIPSELNQLPAVQTANLDNHSTSDNILRFDLSVPATIYVAFDTTADRLPQWVREFRDETMQVEIEDEFARIVRNMRVYAKYYPPGSVVLGGNQALGYQGNGSFNYLVIVKPLQ